jgi:hypothetical protein
MKKLSETYKELGIAFSFPIEITDANGRLTYREYSDDYWERYERDAKGRSTYHEDSNGYWSRWDRDADGNMVYYEDCTGSQKGTPRRIIMSEERTKLNSPSGSLLDGLRGDLEGLYAAYDALADEGYPIQETIEISDMIDEVKKKILKQRTESLTKPPPKPEELCAFCEKPDVFLKGLCPICFDDHYGD